MASDILEALIRANLAAAAAILLVLVLRRPVRKLAGPALAYSLWLLVPLVAAAVLLPRMQAPLPVTVAFPAPVADAVGWQTLPSLAPAMAEAPARLDWTPILLSLWLAVALMAAGLVLWRHARFRRSLGRLTPAAGGAFRAERAGFGPAVLGALAPRIILPADFDARFEPAHARAILAHEQAHLARLDAQANALVVLCQCLCWFNPLVHIAAFHLRLDQELACDAAVTARYPEARRAYAQALLQTQLAPASLPLGCYWPARSAHPLRERLAMLKKAPPSRARRLAGASAIALVTLGAGYAAWAAGPPSPSAPIAFAAPPAPTAAPLAAPRSPAPAETGAAVATAATATPEPQPPAPTMPFDMEAYQQFAMSNGLDADTARRFAQDSRVAAMTGQEPPTLAGARANAAGVKEALDAGYARETAEMFGGRVQRALQRGEPRPSIQSLMPLQNMTQRLAWRLDQTEWPTFGPRGTRIGDTQLKGTITTTQGQVIPVEHLGMVTAGVTSVKDTGEAMHAMIRPEGDELRVLLVMGLEDGQVIDTGVIRARSRQRQTVQLEGGHTFEFEAWLNDEERVRRMYEDPASYPRGGGPTGAEVSAAR